MNQNQPSPEEWRRLFDLALQVKELAPWESLWEDEIFGVQSPETDEIGFVSAMGKRGEHLAIAVYLGPKGFHGFLELKKTNLADYPERVFEIPQLQASFEDREQLTPKERTLIKELGYRFRGRNAYPKFTSVDPGFMLWHVDSSEASFLACALEQVLDVTPRFKNNPNLLQPTKDGAYLVRVPKQSDGGLAWEDQRLEMPAPAIDFPTPLDPTLREEAKKLPGVTNPIEIDLFGVMSPLQDSPKQRPYFPYCLMIVEAETGQIIGHELLPPLPSLKEMRGQVPMEIAKCFLKLKVLPGEITVREGLVPTLLRPLASELGIQIKALPSLPSLDEAKSSMFEYLRRH